MVLGAICIMVHICNVFKYNDCNFKLEYNSENDRKTTTKGKKALYMAGVFGGDCGNSSNNFVESTVDI